MARRSAHRKAQLFIGAVVAVFATLMKLYHIITGDWPAAIGLAMVTIGVGGAFVLLYFLIADAFDDD